VRPNAGGPFWTLLANIEDVGADLITVTIDWGDGTDPQLYGTVSPATQVWAEHTYYTNVSRTYDVQVTAVDDDTGTAVFAQQITVNPPIALLEDHIWGWEAQDLNFYISSITTHGQIAVYELDVNNDGTYDFATSNHLPAINGVLEFDLALLHLLGNPADDAEYPAKLRITTDWDYPQVYPVEITIGNMPPDIQFGGATEGEPGVPFFLDVSTSDPGPDTVTHILVEWGDGTSSTIIGGAGTVSHVYPSDGKYLIRATATDEDDSYWAEQFVNIGDTDAPIVESEDPEILSAVATILPNGNASFTVQAVDNGGSPNVSYEWDLDGDGVFELSGPATVELMPGANFYPFSATLRVTDAVGAFTEVLFGFMQAGGQAGQGTINSYEGNFKRATPDLPPDWKVHHRIGHRSDKLTKRFWDELGINLHALDNLRGVPDSIHKEVTAAQNAWWKEIADEEFGGDLNRAYAEIDLARVTEFAAKLDTGFGDKWITSGPGKSNAVKNIQNYLKKNASRWALAKTARWQGLGLKVVAALPIASLLISNAEAAERMYQFDPETHPEFRAFMSQYESCLQLAIDGQLKQAKGVFLVEAFTRFCRSLALDEETITKMEYVMNVWVYTKLPP
jgi:hypothetical protein